MRALRERRAAAFRLHDIVARMRYRRTMRAAGVALPCAGCGADAPEAAVRAARDLGPLAFDPVIRGRDGGYSARWGDSSVWVFGDTTLETPGEDGSSWRSSTFCATDELDASDGLSSLTEPLDAAGAPGVGQRGRVHRHGPVEPGSVAVRRPRPRGARAGRRAGGVYVTYLRETGFLEGEIRLVELEIE
ncbi:hypothetical protein [Sorangium sp. So ce176]|uniref:hypothetical protein n=1 Tax=Sorangium sp. So ce176 TaxID=3133286 RepID=UPI003F5F8817